MVATMLVQVVLVIFTNLMFSNSEEICIKWDKAKGTRAFVDQIYEKYGRAGNKQSPMMERKNFNQLLHNLRIGTVLVKCQDDDDDCIKNKHAFHAIEAGNKITPRKRREAAVEKSEEELEKAHEIHWKKHIKNCYKSVDFLSLHGVNDTLGISEKDFLRMCPSLVQQIDNRMCVHHHKKVEHDDHLPTTIEIWGYGFISITIISLLSLSVIAIIPCLKKSYYAKVMAFLVALAVGTLAGDALLHLIPHAFVEGANTATNATISEADELNQHYSQVWRAMFVLLGLYVFFVVEQIMKLKAMCGEKSDHSDDHGIGADPPIVPTKEVCLSPNEEKASLCARYESKGPSVETESNVPLEHSLSCTSDVHNDHNHEVDSSGHFHADDRHHHHHHGHTEKVITKETKISSVAWMVIVGDGFHNFSDGVAVGAAFSASLTSGISTAIAVFCHELPHELGDFAILVKSGMTIKQAIVYNLVSALLAYLGLVIGILAGGNELGRHFILSITAGMFLYISLADMLPELTHQDVPYASRCSAFICQHLGLLSGVAIMLFISLYEHQM